MDWLNSFDPAAPKSSASRPPSSRSHDGAARPPQTGRTIRPHQSQAHAGPSTSTNQSRPPRPPHRIKAAPPSSALRAEDAQPNEHEVRTKPWEISAPPSIGVSKSKQQTCPVSTQPQSSSQPFPNRQHHPLPPRPPWNPRPPDQRPPHRPYQRQAPQQGPPPRACQQSSSRASQAQQPDSRRNLPQRPSTPQTTQNTADKKQSVQGPSQQPPPQLTKKQRKQMNMEAQQRAEQRNREKQERQRERRYDDHHREHFLAKKARVEASSSVSTGTTNDKDETDQASSKANSNHEDTRAGSKETKANSEEDPPTNSDARDSKVTKADPLVFNDVRSSSPSTPPPPPVCAPSFNGMQQKPSSIFATERRSTTAGAETPSPKLSRLRGVSSTINRSPQPSLVPGKTGALDAVMEEARQAEALARYLEQLSDDEGVSTSGPAHGTVALQEAIDFSTTTFSDRPTSIKSEDSRDNGFEPAKISSSTARHGDDDDNDDYDDDDRPLAAITSGLGQGNSKAATRNRQPSIDSDPDEDVPLRDLLNRQPSAGPSAQSSFGSGENSSKGPSEQIKSTITGLAQFTGFSNTHGFSIKYFVPLASATLANQTSVRRRATMFDAAIGVSEHGGIATFLERRIAKSDRALSGLPSKVIELRSWDSDAKVKKDKAASPIDRVEDVSRLTSKVCGIASSTRKLLGVGSYDDYPRQVSLVSVDDAGRHRTYHLDERPHAQGAASISHFPRTDPNDASSIDFATGGIDGIVNHWHWKARSSKAETFRLHTLHDAKPVVALEHLSSRSNVLASASIGTVVGFDLAALTLGFSWNTSDHIVHLQRTPDPKLMLGVLARRDYDQFRMFDITGRNGPISRPVISFGWLNDSEGSLPLGRGTFHPTRRAIFAHGAEDGHVRIWDLRNARDPLIDEKIGDAPIVQTIWASAQGDDDDDDIMYVATSKGVRSISLLAP